MDELIYTMTSPLEGTSSATIQSALSYVLPLTILTAFVAAGFSIAFRRKKRSRRIFSISAFCLSFVILVSSSFYFLVKVDAFSYVKNRLTHSTFIDDHYVDPNSTAITFPEEKRNLVYIFLESMEITFSDLENGGGMKENIIPDLTQIGLENETFSGDSGILNGGYALQGSTWTIAGMFAQTAALPLTVSNETLSLSDDFLPGITTMGDILEDAGYKNILCIGTSASFANRDLYFITHGNYEILDYSYSVENGEIPEDYSRNWWGYDDYILYENAKAHLTELAASGEPFNFTMLTVDTHTEDGYLCPLCPDTFGDNKYANALSCASTQAADFIKWIQKQDFYENTTIVIAGDHCTMDSDFCDDVSDDYERRIYTVYINPAAEPSGNAYRTYSSMDNFPTTLGALGVEIEGNRLGLGTNLFSDTPTLMESYGKDEMNAELAQKSDLLTDAVSSTSERQAVVSYDPKALCFSVSTDGELEYDGDFSYVYCTVANTNTGESGNYIMSEEDGVYTVPVPIKYFGSAAGTYTFDIYLFLPDGLPKWYCTNTMTIEEDYFPTMTADVSDDYRTIDITLEDADYEQIWFSVYTESADHGPDDVTLYTAEKSKNVWQSCVDLCSFNRTGNYVVDVYSGTDSPEEKIMAITVPVDQLPQQ